MRDKGQPDLGKIVGQSVCAILSEIRETRVAILNEGKKLRSALGLATKQDLERMEKRIMAKLDDYLPKITEFLDNAGPKIDAIASGVDGLSNDIEDLKNQLADAIAGSPELSPEHVATFEGILAKITDLDTRSTDLADKTKALDDMHPPVPPT